MATGDLCVLSEIKQYLGLLGKPITGITQANPAVITCNAHGLSTGAQVGLSGINGMSTLNDLIVTATVLTPNTFSIGVNTTAASPYVSGGYVSVDDPILSRLITQVSAWIKTIINRDLNLQTYSEIRSSYLGQTKLQLYQYPVFEIYSVTVNGSLIKESTNQNIAGWVQDYDSVAFRNMSLPKGYANVVINYAAGYDPMPMDINQACMELVAWRYKEKDRIAQTNKSVGGENVTFITAKEGYPHIMKIIDEYKRVSPQQVSSKSTGIPINPQTQQGTAVLTTTTTALNQVVDTVSTLNYKTIHYLVQVNSGNDYQISQITLVTNGLTVSITEYGLVTSATVLATFTADLYNNNIRLLVSPVNPSTTIKAFRTAISVGQ